jgi:hypothetical protein
VRRLFSQPVGRRRLLLATVAAPLPLLLTACGAGAGNATRDPQPPAPAVGVNGEVDNAPYVSYEKVSYERLPKSRVEAEGEVRIAQQVRRLPAYRLRDGGTSAIRFTDDAGRGWLAWQPAVVLRARRDLGQQENVTPAQITTLGVNRVDWPDACLGIPGAGFCTQTVTPGFKVTLRYLQTVAVFHTDRESRVLRAPA